MPKFLAGFLCASALWAVVAVLFSEGLLTLGEPEAPVVEESVEDAPAETETSMRGRRGRLRRGRRQAASTSVPAGNATTGDDLGENDPRSLEMGALGGEAQLSNGQIEAAMDGAFGRIRRCLVLAAGDDPVRGRLVFGLRIDPSGRVSRVNLSGPAAVTTGESGDCLRSAARSVSFPSFDGPPMVARYPVTLD